MSDKPTFENIDQCVEHWRQHWGVPGIAVAVLHDGEVTANGYGVTSIETEYPVTPDTMFQIGSISKVYTTSLVMALVDEGKLDLDEPVKTYLPELKLKDKGVENSVTLRHLVSHTSGIFGDHFEDFGMGDDALERYVESMAELRQIYQPNELWSYTNSGFNLAGRVMERVLDMQFEDIMRERILDKAGFDRTFQFPVEAITYPLAVGHVHPDPHDEATLEVARRYPLPRTSHAAGGIIATVGDQIKFAQLHLNKGKAGDTQVLSEQAVADMQVAQTKAAGLADEWGLGWMLFNTPGYRSFGHGGTTNGFQALLRIVPERNFAISILTNGDRGHAAEAPILKWALSHYLGIELPEHQPVELEEEQLNRFVGNYTQKMVDMVVRNEDGTLWVDMFSKSALADTVETKQMPAISLAPLGGLKFLVTSGAGVGNTLDFVENADGSLRFIRYGGRFADRVEE